MAKKSVNKRKVAKTKNRENNRENSLKNLEKTMWQPGESGNPNGRPKGSINVSTRYKRGFEMLAKLNKKTPEQLEAEMFSMAIKKATLGDHKFFETYIHNVYGRPAQKNINLDIDVDDEEIDEKAKEVVQRYLGLVRNSRKQGQKKN